MPQIRQVLARRFQIPLSEVLSDAKHGDHTHFELITVTITLDDGGISGLIVAAASAEAGQPEGALRTQVSGLVQGMTLAILGNSDEALVAAQSLGKFLGGDARSVTVTLTATDPAGLGIADVAAFEQDPTALSGKVTIAATASGEPVTLPAPSAAPAPADGGTQDEKLKLKN